MGVGRSLLTEKIIVLYIFGSRGELQWRSSCEYIIIIHTTAPPKFKQYVYYYVNRIIYVTYPKYTTRLERFMSGESQTIIVIVSTGSKSTV